ncbi:MAG: WavE lipopolysaccharide synthesis family protein [Alphaproteobacteria bacterium]
MINTQHENITFVMAGPIFPETQKSIEQIKKLFSKSPIILSTWKNQDLSDINVDEIILNNDPGKIGNQPDRFFQNYNRMVLSVYNGLKSVKTKYVLRIRTDSTIHNDNFLKLYNKMIASNLANPTVFKQPILVSQSLESFASPYFVSDFFQFGLTEDISALWNTPLATEQEADWFKNKKYNFSILRPFNNETKDTWCKYYSSEQTMFCKYLYKKGIDIDFKHQQDEITFKKLKNSITTIVNNCFLCSVNEIKFHSSKYPHLNKEKNMVNNWFKIHNMNKFKWFFFLFKMYIIRLRYVTIRLIGVKKFRILKYSIRIILLILIIYKLLI